MQFNFNKYLIKYNCQKKEIKTIIYLFKYMKITYLQLLFPYKGK